MIGTAGHVDHGKTSLVRALTGFETDRHLEEKQRGLSIDISVAPCALGDGTVAGIVDVPGHEDFIRNMVAGAASIDLMILVVAADDSVMPQTAEHVRIGRLLGVKHAIVAVTKVDLVDPSLIPIVIDDATDLLQSEGYRIHGSVRVSSPQLIGVEDLRTILRDVITSWPEKPVHRAFRMDIRHAFSMKGFGTVVTGVPSAGSIGPGSEVELLPRGTRHVIRSVQHYRSQVERTIPHVSSALNIRDVETTEVGRGDTVIHPHAYIATSHAIVSFRSVHAAPLPRRMQTRFHIGTSAVQASFRMIDCDVLAPGAEAFAFVKLGRSTTIAAGDRFVVRTSSPAQTLGGGIVLSVHSGRARRLTERFLERLLVARTHAEADRRFEAELYAGSQATFSMDALLRRTQLRVERGREVIEALILSGELIDLGGGGSILANRLDDVGWALDRALARYHHVNKLVWGMKPDFAADVLGVPHGTVPRLLEKLGDRTQATIKHGRVALGTFTPQISPRLIKLREQVLHALQHAGVQSVARGPLAQELGMTEAETKQVLRLLADEGEVQVLGANVILRSVVDSCRTALLEIFNERGVVDLGVFRERTGASRNIATLILDSFDSEGLTRRTDAGRVLARGSRKPR